MKVNKHFNVSILLIIVTVLTTAYSIKQNSGMNKFKQFRNKKNIIMGTLKMNGKAFRNWKTSSIARNFNKVIGFVPIIKENDIHKLLELVLNEADLIKIEALKKLSKLSYRNLSEKSKKDLIIAKLQATIELIKYYSVIYNWPKVNITFHQGLFYAYCCQKIFNDNPGECFKRKTQLLESFIFRHKIEINRGMRRWLTKTSKEAEKYLKDDKTLQFINTKIACEIKFIQANKNKLLKAVMKFYMGGTKKEKTYNCVTELKVFEKDLKEIGSYPGEYHYLLAKAYDHQGDDESTLKHLRIARKAEVVDTKTRNINKKVQEYYEKIYTRVNKFQNHYSISLL